MAEKIGSLSKKLTPEQEQIVNDQVGGRKLDRKTIRLWNAFAHGDIGTATIKASALRRAKSTPKP